MDYNGADTYVHVYNVRGPDIAGAMTADISVEPGPLVGLVDVTMVELSGNGDGLVEGGETAGIYPRVAVSRSDARSMVLRARLFTASWLSGFAALIGLAEGKQSLDNVPAPSPRRGSRTLVERER